MMSTTLLIMKSLEGLDLVCSSTLLIEVHGKVQVLIEVSLQTTEESRGGHKYAIVLCKLT